LADETSPKDPSQDGKGDGGARASLGTPAKKLVRSVAYRPHLRLPTGYWKTPEAQESLQKVRRGRFSALDLAEKLGTTPKAVQIALERHRPKGADEKKDPRATQFTAETSQRANALRHSTEDPMDAPLRVADDILHNNVTELVPKAVETLAVIMNKAPRPETRLRAVQIVLEHSLGKPRPKIQEPQDQSTPMTWEVFVKLIDEARRARKTATNNEGDEGSSGA
jgi:hypothetical protein